MSAPPDPGFRQWLGGALFRRPTAGAMDAITDTDTSYASLQRRYETHKRNVDHLEERVARHGSDVPLQMLNDLAEEKRNLGRLRELLSDPSAFDAVSTKEQIALILARQKRVEQRLLSVVASGDDDWQNRQERQREIDARAAADQLAREQRQREVDARDQARDQRDTTRDRIIRSVLWGIAVLCLVAVIADVILIVIAQVLFALLARG